MTEHESIEQKVYRIGSEVFGSPPSKTIEEAMMDETFLSICEIVKRVIKDGEPKIALL